MHKPQTFPRPQARSQLVASRVVQTVAESMKDAGIVEGARLVLGCSGGPDSTALMVALCLLRERLGYAVQVVCVDHGLRNEATEEAHLVEQVALRLGLSARRMTVQVPKQSSLQAAARTARYRALSEAARDFGSQTVLVAHTLNDQAETVLQRLIGGAGPRGLSGMPSLRALEHATLTPSVLLLRPLLAIERSLILEFLREADDWISPLPLFDRSNHDLRFTRAVIRHNVLPQLQAMQPSVIPHLGRLAEQLAEDASYLESLATEKLPHVVARHAPNVPEQLAALSVTRLRELPKPISTRLLIQVAPTPLASVHLAALHGLCEHVCGTQSLDLPDGLIAERRYDTLYLRRRCPSPGRPEVEQTTIPGCGSYSHGRHRIRFRYLDDDDAPIQQSSPFQQSSPSAVFTLPAPGFPLWLRSPRAGDRLRLLGGHRKISDILVDAKLPRSERSSLLLLGYEQEPLWLLGLRLAVQAPPLQDLCYVKVVAEWVTAPSEEKNQSPSRTITP